MSEVVSGEAVVLDVPCARIPSRPSPPDQVLASQEPSPPGEFAPPA
jgi:hypothetical protein